MVDVSDIERMERAEALLGHAFADRALLQRALTHPSFSNEPNCGCDYERLEFLGDAVLGLIIVDELYNRFGEMPEGIMTKIKIAVVAGSTLAEVGSELGIDELLRVGQSERGTGGRGMASALENALEALLGALYLDAGLEVTRGFILKVLGDRIVPEAAEMLEHPKSRLQELVQAKGHTPDYRIVAVAGPPHDRSFTAEVFISETRAGSGSGHSKKEAEMNAAAAALDWWQEDS